MSKNFNENSRVKIPALIHLTRLNYKFISLKNAAAQIDGDTNIYKISFRAALNQINNLALSNSDIDFIIGELKNFLSAEDLGRQFFEKIQGGISFGEKIIQLIDFKNPANNIFEAMAEVPYQSGRNSFRPDITIFINGLPLAFVEVKIPDNKGGIQAERRRINDRFAQKKYRRFANITQLMIFSNNAEYDDAEIIPLEGAFYAASDYREIIFNRFREENPEIFSQIQALDENAELQILRDLNYLSIRATPEFETNKNPLTPTNKILTSIFARERIIFILRYAFAYVEDSTAAGIKKIHKHVMRYQQIFAELGIEKMLARGGTRGVIWHTQGSGKTALAFYSVKFLTDYFHGKNFAAQFYFIVDRIDLAKQAIGEFVRRGLEVNEISSRENFIAAIRRSGNIGATGKLSISVVNIQKFSDDAVTRDSDFNVNLQRVYFIDEAHRNYKWNGSFLARLMNSDRNAIKIALTGTPLIGEFKTRDIFGKYIHSYYYNRSIDDGYTVRLIREEIGAEYRLKLARIFRREVEKGSLPEKKIFAHKNFVAPLAEFIETDFAESRRLLNDSIGAMVVCNSSEQAKAICAEINQRGKFSAELILYSEENVAAKIKNFKAGKTDILVVYQMLLTGFDAPRLKKLYLGRKIKEHNLLQALTRVNRPYQKMRYGYIVDFADIQREFDKANQAYLEELQLELGADFDKYQKIFKAPEEILSDLEFARKKLAPFTTDNAEKFRAEIHAIKDKKNLLELHRALELYKDCYNLAQNYGYEDLKDKFDVAKIFDLAKIVSNRLQILRQKEILSNSENFSLLNLALENLEFNFEKISEQELSVANKFLNLRRELCREFEINADKKDPEYVTLLEELRRILAKHNVEEMTVIQMQDAQIELVALKNKIHALNENNCQLTEKYCGDKKFMRIHKRLAALPDFDFAPEFLIAVKLAIDEKLAANYAVLENEPYFERGLWRELKNLLENPTLQLIKDIAAIVAQEYFDERKNPND